MPLLQAASAGTAAAASSPPSRVRRFMGCPYAVVRGGRGVAPRPAGRREEDAVQGGERQVEYDGDDRDEDGTTEHLDEIALGEAVEDVPAEAAEADVRGDGGRGHDLDERESQPGHDQRHRERDLDLEEDLVAAHALAAGGVLHLRVHGGHARVGVGDDRRDGEGHQRHVHRGHGQSAGQEDEDDQSDGGQCAAEGGEVDGEEGAAPGVPDEQPDGQGDRRRDEGGEQRVLEVLGEPVPDAVRARPLGAADEPATEVLEELVHVRPASFARG